MTPTAGGEHNERVVMDRTIESHRTYMMDVGYEKFELFNRIVDAGSSYVCRIPDNSVFTVLEEKPLTDAVRTARVLSDQLISLGSAVHYDERRQPPRRQAYTFTATPVATHVRSRLHETNLT